MLNDAENTRVLARAGFIRAIGRTGKAKGGRAYDEELQTPVFLTAENLKPFISQDLLSNSKPIIFSANGKEMIGYRAEPYAKTVEGEGEGYGHQMTPGVVERTSTTYRPSMGAVGAGSTWPAPAMSGAGSATHCRPAGP